MEQVKPSKSSYMSWFKRLSFGEKQILSLLLFAIAYSAALIYAIQGRYQEMQRLAKEEKSIQDHMILDHLENLVFNQEILVERVSNQETLLKDELRDTNNSISSIIDSFALSNTNADTPSLIIENSAQPSIIKNRWQDIVLRAESLPAEARHLLYQQFIVTLEKARSEIKTERLQREGVTDMQTSDLELHNYLLPDLGFKLEQLLHAVLQKKKDLLPYIIYDINNLKNKIILFTEQDKIHQNAFSEKSNKYLDALITSLNELIALTGKEGRNEYYIQRKLQQTFQQIYDWQKALMEKQAQMLANTSYYFKRNFFLTVSLLIAIGLFAGVFFYNLHIKAEKNSLLFYQAMVNLKDGNFNTELKETNEKDLSLLARTFNQMAENVRNLVSWFQQTGIQLTSSTTEITANAKEQEATLLRQEKTTRHIALAARTISATAKELARMMNEINGSAEATSSLASNGKKELVRMEVMMKQLVEASSNIASKLATLNDKANTITNVISTIAKVADQTNLLSLNAAIEAEKAGEHGRSFSVIAREIRRLADQTANATLDIEKMVNEMVSAVSAGVLGVDKFSLEIHEGAKQLGLVSEHLSKIIQQVEQQTLSFEAVNHGMQEQSQNAEKINASIEELSLSVEQTTKSIKQFHKAIEDQHIAIKTMQRYRTGHMTEKPAKA